MSHAELIEWCIVKQEPERLLRHSEGAQTVFGLTRARQIAKKLGPSWRIRHIDTQKPPEE